MKLRSRCAAAPLLLAAGVLAAEATLRLAGLLDFPTYHADATIGYIPAPSQAGAFLGTNNWAFNSLSMGVADEFAPSARRDTVLVGDSVVFGGNPYRQAEKLGPQLQALLGEPVWPVSAGSWGFRNALTYLALHPEVLAGADELVLVLNSGDFGQATSWTCDRTHPRARPWSASVYLIERYILRMSDCVMVQPAMQVPAGDWRQELRALAQRAEGKPMRVFLYPDLAEARAGNYGALEGHVQALQQAAGPDTQVYSVGRDPRWSTTHYRDDIHPSPAGNAALAAIIARPSRAALLPTAQP